MKKQLIIALALTLVVVAFAASPAWADNGPHGGIYSSTTDACAGCHRVHTGVGAPLLKSTSIYGLCTSCHNGTSANTNVIDGKWQPNNAALKGGGFTNATMNTALTGATTGATSSQHKVNGMAGYTGDTMWGNGLSGAGPSVTLECSSCHDPHGKASSAGAATYRILRGTPSVSGAGSADVTDVSTKYYTVTSTTSNYYGQMYPAASDADTDNGKIAAITTWCETCHTRLHGTDGSVTTGDSIYTYRHPTNGTNVTTTWTNGTPACLTCHVAHGTSAAMGTGTYSATVPKPGTAEGGGSYLDSSLLRVNNRGVCELCHNK